WSMEQALQPLYEKWEKDVQKWDADDRRRRLEELNKCKTPGEKANHDLDLFLAHYFLTDGQPDQQKTPRPLSLEGFDQRLTLHLKAGEIPGLYTVSGGSGNNRTICIGWDIGSVNSLARSIDARAREAEKREREMKWEKAMEAHAQFTSTLKPPPPSRGRKAKPRFDLEQYQGSYIVKCDSVTNGWKHLNSHILTMNIFLGEEGSLTANYDFGIITGTMLLSNDEETLDDLVGDSGSDDDSAESKDNDEETKKGRKRSLVKDTKRKSKGRPVKKKKAGPSLSRRVFYRLRGKETSEGQILPDPEPGQIDFVNNNYFLYSEKREGPEA
ncbi:hypothetical protein IL306_014090, partial [Fusarium sp. DS 682]